MKASVGNIYRPLIWVIYLIFGLTVQSLYLFTDASPDLLHRQAVEVLYIVYAVWTVLLLIFGINGADWFKKARHGTGLSNKQAGGQTIQAFGKTEAFSKSSGDSITNQGVISKNCADQPLIQKTNSLASHQSDNHTQKDSLRAETFLQNLLIIFESGKTGQAVIQGVGYTGEFMGQHPFLRLNLIITQKNKPRLKVVACTLVNKHLIPRIGDHCSVKYLLEPHPIVVILEFL